MQPWLAVVLLVSGVAANAPFVVIAAFGGSRHVQTSTVVVFAAAGALLDVVHAFARDGRLRGWTRPPAVRTQVPQRFGHRSGPWLAALRYGPRLGVGPATILDTWLWWSALVIAVLSGWRATLTACAVYVCVRTIVTVATGVGITTGTVMARRAALLERVRVPVLAGAHAVAVIVVTAAALLR